ncbi:MAG: Ni/Fe hydrogenase subunit alpha [Chloroflexi bacterium]|jgi:F420-non-reducing hydrogenase large subunit|nr:Ni/Fe hydrogenase subunit alpha [Anaerolineaceae bacterium]NLC13340.1 Ni/Fe hydrogenase subunit alpha [Chloroflexota bacterium]
MTTITYPLSRIEGHARVVIDIHDDEVFRADFQAMEMRGFSYYVQGVPAEQITVIVPRICGVCSTAHQVASVKALEDVFGVTPPPLAEEIREVLLLGQLIQNQATSLFIFTMPDRVNASSLFEVSDTQTDKELQFSLAQKALRIRKIGTDLISLAGGQFIHPIKTVIGGVTSGIPRQKADEMIKTIDELLPIADALVDTYWQMSMEMGDRIGSWGDDEPTYYLASTEADNFRLNSKHLRLMCPEGKEYQTFDPHEFKSYLQLEDSDYSYAGISSFQGQIMRANSLARINLTTSFGTPRADIFLKRFVETFGRPAHAIMFFDLCRGIELVYALEKARLMLETDLEHGETEVAYTPRDGVGYGLVEAPRGPLLHHYEVENGLIKNADFIIPTVHNMLAIRRALMVVAKRYVSADGISSELGRAVGRVVRAFDPCIACATK